MPEVDLSNYISPRIPYSIIRAQAEDFRNTFWNNKPIPIDILHIIEFDLKLEIIPIPGLKKAGDIDSFLLGDFSGIAVDEEEYMDDRYNNRIRFSVAHEIGHLVLHKDIYEKCNFACLKSEEEWIELVEKLPQEDYNWLEQQAYEFAGRLLIPVGDLKKYVDEFREEINLLRNSIPDIEDVKIAEHLAPKICKNFEVSPNVISKRIIIEKLL